MTSTDMIVVHVLNDSHPHKIGELKRDDCTQLHTLCDELRKLWNGSKRDLEAILKNNMTFAEAEVLKDHLLGEVSILKPWPLFSVEYYGEHTGGKLEQLDMWRDHHVDPFGNDEECLALTLDWFLSNLKRVQFVWRGL